MFRPAMIPNFRPRLGRLKIKGIAAISLTRIIRKKTSHKRETLVCGLVSNPIGAGNSNTVIIKMAIIAPTAPHLAGIEALGLSVNVALFFIPDSLSDITALHPQAQ